MFWAAGPPNTSWYTVPAGLYMRLYCCSHENDHDEQIIRLPASVSSFVWHEDLFPACNGARALVKLWLGRV